MVLAMGRTAPTAGWKLIVNCVFGVALVGTPL